MLKAAVISIDMKNEKVDAITFFEGPNCWREASAFLRGIEGDFPSPQFKNVCISTKEAKREGMKELGIILEDA